MPQRCIQNIDVLYMPRYIDFIAKVIGNKSNRRTRNKRGGGFTNGQCNMDHLTGEVTTDSLKSKIREPKPLNLQLEPGNFMSGSFNIAKEVSCSIDKHPPSIDKKPNSKKRKIEEPLSKRKKTKSNTTKLSEGVILPEKVICRFWTKLFYINKKNKIVNLNNSGSTEDELKLFAQEITINIEQSRKGNALPIYDIQAVPINGPLLDFLTKEKKIEYFDIDPRISEEVLPINRLVCLCVVMKKGDPYKITLDNFHKTMDLFDRIAETHICMDIKTENLLCSGDRVVMIDWDPIFIKKMNDVDFELIENKVLFGGNIMKYLFCILLLIHILLIHAANIINIDTATRDMLNEFIKNILGELNKIMETKIELTDRTDTDFLFIMSSFYNNTDAQFFLSGKVGKNFQRIIESYEFDRISKHFTADGYMYIRNYLVNCEEKAEFENLLLPPDVVCVYDNTTQSLRYKLALQCSPSVFHNVSSLFGHRCLKEITDVNFEIGTDDKVTLSYTMDGIRQEKASYPYVSKTRVIASGKV